MQAEYITDSSHHKFVTLKEHSSYVKNEKFRRNFSFFWRYTGGRFDLIELSQVQFKSSFPRKEIIGQSPSPLQCKMYKKYSSSVDTCCEQQLRIELLQSKTQKVSVLYNSRQMPLRAFQRSDPSRLDFEQNCKLSAECKICNKCILYINVSSFLICYATRLKVRLSFSYAQYTLCKLNLFWKNCNRVTWSMLQ